MEHLPTKDGETIMRSIADSYFDKGVESGIEKGAINKALEIAVNMLKQNLSFDIVKSVTGLPSDEILKLKKNTKFINFITSIFIFSKL